MYKDRSLDSRSIHPGPGKEPVALDIAEGCIRRKELVLECLGHVVQQKTDWVRGPTMRLEPLLCSIWVTMG